MARKKVKKRFSSVKIIATVITVTVLSFLLLILVSSAVYLFGFRPHKVSGNSMAPEFPKESYILSEKITYRDKLPERGDVVIVQNPRSQGQDLIQRVIGLPNDKLMIKDGRVYINGDRLEEPYLAPRTYTNSGEFLEDNIEFQIPENFYILMGDNRGHATDSRTMGPISHDYIESKVSFCYANCP